MPCMNSCPYLGKNEKLMKLAGLISAKRFDHHISKNSFLLRDTRGLNNAQIGKPAKRLSNLQMQAVFLPYAAGSSAETSTATSPSSSAFAMNSSILFSLFIFSIAALIAGSRPFGSPF